MERVLEVDNPKLLKKVERLRQHISRYDNEFIQINVRNYVVADELSDLGLIDTILCYNKLSRNNMGYILILGNLEMSERFTQEFFKMVSELTSEGHRIKVSSTSKNVKEVLMSRAKKNKTDKVTKDNENNKNSVNNSNGTNKNVENSKPKSKEEQLEEKRRKLQIEYARGLTKYFQKDGSKVYSLDTSRKYSFISDDNTVNIIKLAIRIMSHDTGIKCFVVNTGTSLIRKAAYKSLAGLEKWGRKNNISVSVRVGSNEKDAQDYIYNITGGFRYPVDISKDINFEEIKVINARDIIGCDTISAGNDKPWEKLYNYMCKVSEPVNFDFEGVEIYSPYESSSFRKLICDKYFYFTIHNNELLKDNIENMCSLSGINGHVRNINDVSEKVETKEERRIKVQGERIFDNIETIDGIGVLNLYTMYDQLGSSNTVDYLRFGINKYCESTKVNKVIVDCGAIHVSNEIVNYLARMVADFKDHKVDVRIKIDSNQESFKNLAMILELPKRKYKIEDKIDIILNSINVGEIFLLRKYVDTRGLDNFGRRGNGKVLWNRVAVYQGLSDDKKKLIFDTYSVATFSTIANWYYTHDYEVNKLDITTVYVPIDEMGIFSHFLGASYHLLRPVQFREEGTQELWGCYNDKWVKKKYTIPELIEAVFNDFNVHYNKEYLRKWIKVTREEMLKNGIQPYN